MSSLSQGKSLQRHNESLAKAMYIIRIAMCNTCNIFIYYQCIVQLFHFGIYEIPRDPFKPGTFRSCTADHRRWTSIGRSGELETGP